MKKAAEFGALLCAVLVLTSARANAQCDKEYVRGTVTAYGIGGQYVRAFGTSTGPSSGCPNNGELQVGTWIPTAPNSDWRQAIKSASEGATVSSRYDGNVWGLHRVDSKHHQIYTNVLGVRVWDKFDENFWGIDLGQPPPPPGCDPGDQQCLTVIR